MICAFSERIWFKIGTELSLLEESEWHIIIEYLYSVFYLFFSAKQSVNAEISQVKILSSGNYIIFFQLLIIQAAPF